MTESALPFTEIVQPILTAERRLELSPLFATIKVGIVAWRQLSRVQNDPGDARTVRAVQNAWVIRGPLSCVCTARIQWLRQQRSDEQG